MFARLKLAAPCDHVTTLSRARTSSQLAGLVAFLPSALARHAARSPPSPWGKEMACACASPARRARRRRKKSNRCRRRTTRPSAPSETPRPRPRAAPGAPDAVALQGLLRRLGRVAVQVLEAEPEEKTPPRRAPPSRRRRWRRRRGPRGGPAGERAGGRGGHDPGLPRGELPGGPRRVPARPQRLYAGARPRRPPARTGATPSGRSCGP